jgi:hypothetical protein
MCRKTLHLRTSACPLERADGAPFEVLAGLREAGPSTRVWVGWCRWNGQRYRVRLIAAPLPPEQAQQARKRKHRKARKRGRRPASNTRVLAGWLLVLTTLAAVDWSAEAMLRLDRARWRVELVFKRFKQLLRVRPLRCPCAEAAEATVHALLIAWVLQEKLATELRKALEQNLQCPVRNWRLCQRSLETLRREVRGHWGRRPASGSG